MTHEKSPSAPSHKPELHPKEKFPGKGGSREGYVAKNEIEDMTLFDEDPGKSPSPEEGKHLKKAKKGAESIDADAVR